MSPVDCLFLDPARRNEHGGKTVAISDCEPNVAELEELLLQKANRVMIKLSPMLDLSLALKELKQTQEVHILSVNNECKELLILLGQTSPAEISIHCVNLFTKGTQKEQHIVIQSNSGLTDEEIEKMMKDAEANAEADAKRKEEVDLRNEVDQAIFATEKTIKETEGKGFDTERDAAQSALDDLKKAQESGNLDDMKAKLEALNEKAQALAVKLYEQAAAAQQAQAGAEGAQTADNSGDDVVDGEFTEK